MPLGLLKLHVEQIFVPRFKRSLTDRLGIIDLEGECIEEANSASESSKTRAVNSRYTNEHLKRKRLCFICNLHRASDDNPYNAGGLKVY